MKEISNDTITGMLLGSLEQAVELFYADEIELIKRSEGVGAPGIKDIIDQISTGMIGYGGVEVVRYKTELEEALQGRRRAEAFVEYVSKEFERWATEHAGFLVGLIEGQLREENIEGDVTRVRKLAELLEKKQDAFPAMLVACYALGPGWDKIHQAG